jgi:hypothetical protein
MANFTVKFHKVVLDSQELGTDEHMVSQLFFSLEVEGENVGEYTANLKQTVGSEFTDANIEVGSPNNYKGPFNYGGFSEVARQYFNNNVGAYGRGIKIEGKSKQVRMRNFAIISEAQYSF